MDRETRERISDLKSELPLGSDCFENQLNIFFNINKLLIYLVNYYKESEHSPVLLNAGQLEMSHRPLSVVLWINSVAHLP